MISPHQLIKAFGHRPTKTLGQHFLTDEGALGRIVAAAGLTPLDVALEVGPGPGVLTCRLLATGARVVAIEKDRRAVAFLRDELPALIGVEAASRLTLLEGDALHLDPTEALAALAPPPYVAVGNLPYNVGTAILMGLLDRAPMWSRAVLMFQREVAQRLVAAAGSRAYGSLSLAVQAVVDAEIIDTLSPMSFSPPPRVHSSVVRLSTPSLPPVPPDLRAPFDRVCRAAFSTRRKTVLNALKGALPRAPADQIVAALDAAGIPPGLRPEQIDLPRFVALTAALAPLL